MGSRRAWVLVLGPPAAAVLALVACGGSVDTPSATPAVALNGDTSSFDAAARGGCAACEATACTTELLACNADPTCARALVCEDACPSDGGQVDAKCAAACDATDGSSATQTALSDLTSCRASAALVCNACVQIPDAGIIDANACDFIAEASVCDQCTGSRCCPEREACHNTPACETVLSCIQACAKTQTASLYQCELSCGNTTPGGLTPFLVYDACINNRCFTETQCGEGVSASDLECASCTNTLCAEENNACGADPNCDLLSGCVGDCAEGDASCLNTCDNLYPSALTAFANLITCGESRCAAQCSH